MFTRLLDKTCGLGSRFNAEKAIQTEFSYARTSHVDRCLSLFNEVEGKIPEWISPHAHNALIGCMKCQMYCPANREYIKLTGRLEDITEEETQRILEGTADEKLLTSLSKKLKNFGPASSKETFPVFTRNLRALMNARNDM